MNSAFNTHMKEMTEGKASPKTFTCFDLRASSNNGIAGRRYLP